MVCWEVVRGRTLSRLAPAFDGAMSLVRALAVPLAHNGSWARQREALLWEEGR